MQAQARAVPAGAFSLAASSLLAGGDPRFGLPSAQQIADARLDDLRQIVFNLSSRLAVWADGPTQEALKNA